MSTNPRNVLNAVVASSLANAGSVFPFSMFGGGSNFSLRSAQQAHDDALYEECTRNKYTPASVHQAFKRRRNLLNRGLGHHAYKSDPYYVNSINNIK